MVSTIDPAEIAEHCQVGEVCATCLRAYKDGDVDVCRWPCLPYRLAEALAASEAKVARVEAYAQQRAIAAHAIGHSDTEGRWLDVLRMLEQPTSPQG